MAGGNLASKRAGRTGRGEKPPPQLGHTPCSLSAAQLGQKVHSKEQIMAAASGGRSRSQHSQLGRSCSMRVSKSAKGGCFIMPLANWLHGLRG